MQFRAANDIPAVNVCYFIFSFFLLLKSEWEYIFGSEDLDYVLWSDSLVIKINDKISTSLVVQD